MRRAVLVLIVAVAAVTFSLPAAAQGNHVLVRARVLGVEPDYASGTIGATGSQLKVGATVGGEVGVTYLLTPKWGFELSAAAMPLDLTTVRGQYPGLDAGSVKLVTGLLALEYRFDTAGRFKPYLGLGMAFAHPMGYSVSSDMLGAGIDSLSFSTSLRLHTQIGTDYEVGRGWRLNVDLRYVPVTTRVDFHLTAGGSLAVVALNVNPILVGVGIGRTF